MNDKEFENESCKIERDSFVAIALIFTVICAVLYIYTLNETAAIIVAIIAYTLGMLFIFKACDSDEV